MWSRSPERGVWRNRHHTQGLTEHSYRRPVEQGEKIMMMKISIPETRAYYPASKNEPDYLLCWIPARELAQLANEGRIARDILDDYPGGLEIEVTDAAFEAVELDLGTSPEAIRRAYAELTEPGLVDGAWLEERAIAAEKGALDFGIGPDLESLVSGEAVPKPKMSDGQDARSVMQSL